MTDRNERNTAQKAQMSRRDALKLGLAAGVGLSVFGLNARIVMADEGQVLKVANPAFNQDWSPLRGGGVPFRWNSIWWASPMYFDSEGKIQPYVFTSWESPDNKVWTFKIDPKAVFSDGSKITAADVKGSWEVASMPNTKSQRAPPIGTQATGGATATGAASVAFAALLAAAAGAGALGALAIGAIAIGRLGIGEATVRRLRIGELDVDHLRVRRLQVLEQDDVS